MGHALTGVTDPRWVLAVRVAESLQGDVLVPEKREVLLKLGRMMGLSPFDANLVIAIVQDQARRGYAPEYCPTAGEPQLRLVPHPGVNAFAARHAGPRRVLRIAMLIAAALALELFLLRWLF